MGRSGGRIRRALHPLLRQKEILTGIDPLRRKKEANIKTLKWWEVDTAIATILIACFVLVPIFVFFGGLFSPVNLFPFSPLLRTAINLHPTFFFLYNFVDRLSSSPLICICICTCTCTIQLLFFFSRILKARH